MSSAGQPYGQGFFSPEDMATETGIRRRQAYANALLQSDTPQGAYGGLAVAGNKLLGAFLANRADKQEQDLAGSAGQRRMAAYAALLTPSQNTGGGVAAGSPSPQALGAALGGGPQSAATDPEGNPMGSFSAAPSPIPNAQGPAPAPTPMPNASGPAPSPTPLGDSQAQPSFASGQMGGTGGPGLTGNNPPPPQSVPGTQGILDPQAILKTGDYGLISQFLPQALQHQQERSDKIWENSLPLSTADQQKSQLELDRQEALAKFNNGLPLTAKDRASLAIEQGQLGVSRSQAAEAARHNRVEETIAQNPFGTGLGAPGAQGKMGDDFLSTLPPGLAAQIKAVGTYRQPAPAGRTSPTGIKFMTLVNQAYPDYDASQYGVKTKARNDFATGKNGNTVRSLNVAVQHLDQLSNLSDALGNGNIQVANQIGNAFNTQFGGNQATNFNAAKQIVGDEIVKAIVGAGGGVSDREEAAHNINSASSPAQLKGVIQTYQGLMSGQLSGLKQQYQKNTGLNDFEDYLAPETKAKLEAHTAPVSKGNGSAPRIIKYDASGSRLP